MQLFPPTAIADTALYSFSFTPTGIAPNVALEVASDMPVPVVITVGGRQYRLGSYSDTRIPLLGVELVWTVQAQSTPRAPGSVAAMAFTSQDPMPTETHARGGS